MSETNQLRLVLLFCLKCGNDKPLKDEHISFSLRVSDDEWQKTKKTFIDCGFLTNKNDLTNWDKRQFLSDSSVDRVKKYRNNRKELGLSSNGYTKHSVTVMERDGNCCVYCGSQNNLCIDHILPTQLGGNDDLDNLATACKACNSGKAGRTPEQARYGFINKQTESIWLSWMSRRVTVTVTPPEQNRTDTEQIQKQSKSKSLNAVAFLESLGVDKKIADDWIILRKQKRASVTETAMQGIQREADKAGYSLEDALRVCCERGWTGFKAEWILQPKKQTEHSADQAREGARARLFGGVENATK